MRARFIKADASGSRDWKLYECEPGGPLPRFVIVSAASVFGAYETYIFEADEAGEVTDWGELDGSFKGGLNHEQALRNAGYEVQS